VRLPGSGWAGYHRTRGEASKLELDVEQILPGTRLTAWVISQLPPPPARILEVGCGSGRLARGLHRHGYDVVAVDPEAPAGRIFRRCRIEEFDEAMRFDAVVASRSLHHVENLSKVLDKIRSLLRPQARIVVNEFACDRFDEATASWFFSRRKQLPVPFRRRFTARSPQACQAKWRRAFRDLYGSRALRRALERRFRTQLFVWTPYFFDFPGGIVREATERRLIERGLIRAIGFRYVGTRRKG
jgi:SAM-dependent methyltransferase